MFNPISAHRQEVSDRILKGFDADTIEKAPPVYVDRGKSRNGKNRRLRISKNGNLYMQYCDDDSKQQLVGEEIITSDGGHLIKNSDMLMKYTEQMKTELKDIIDSSKGFELTRDDKDWKQSKSTFSAYLKFKKDGVRFAVRVSDHTKPVENNSTIYAVHLETEAKRNNKNGTFRNIQYWVIDASLGNIVPKSISGVVNKISKLWNKYNSNSGFEDVMQFAKKHDITPDTPEDKEIMVAKLAETYLNEHKMKDDKLRIAYQVLRVVSRKVLETMINENEDDDDD